MVGPWPHAPYSFRALKAVFGTMYIRCDSCRRFAVLAVPARLLDHDYRRVSFSCSRCGAEAATTVIRPDTEPGMGDYREDRRHSPERHPDAEERFRRRSGHAQEFLPPKFKPTR